VVSTIQAVNDESVVEAWL